MRTTINIDEALMKGAMEATGLRTKRETIEAGLKLLVVIGDQAAIRKARGKYRWQGDSDRMRRDR